MQKRTQVLIPLIDFTIREIEIVKVKSKPKNSLSEHTSEIMAKLSCELEEDNSGEEHSVLSYRNKFYIEKKDE